MPTCTVNRANQLPYMQKNSCRPRLSKAVLAWLTGKNNSNMAQVKAVTLSRQSLYAVPTRSTVQVGILVLPPCKCSSLINKMILEMK